jgi:hypothetical protein
MNFMEDLNMKCFKVLVLCVVFGSVDLIGAVTVGTGLGNGTTKRYECVVRAASVRLPNNR